jgi:hypothetical protein
MSNYNEDISELLNYTKALYKEVRRLNMKIRNERMERLIKKIPARTVLFDSSKWNKTFDNNKEIDINKIVIKFE